MARSKGDKRKGQGRQSPIVSTSEGRQRFPDILQTSFGDKAVIGFDRYGRALGAIVPIEAVMLLAGGHVDEDIRKRIQDGAKLLLDAFAGRSDARSAPRKGAALVDDDEVMIRRRARRRTRLKRKAV